MPAPKKITERHHADLLRLAGDGKTGVDMAAHLLATYGVSVTDRACLKVLAQLRRGRDEVAKTVLADRLGKTLVADLDALDGLMARTRALEARCERSGDEALALKAQAEQRQQIDTRLKYGGGRPDAPALDPETDARLAGKLARLLAGSAAGGGTGGAESG